MIKERQSQVLERRVATWLQQIGATFVSEALIGKKLRADFLLVQPFPMVIEILAGTAPSALRLRTTRLLNLRLRVEQELGGHVPFVVLRDARLDMTLPFADATFSVTDLPNLESLSNVRSNPEFLAFFSEASATSVRLTEVSEFKPLWKNALTLEQLWMEDPYGRTIAGHRSFRSDSLAWQISKQAQAIAATEVPAATQRPDLALVSRARMRCIRSVVENTLRSAIGGKQTTIRVEPPFLRGQKFTFDAWDTPSKGKVVVALQVWSDIALTHKIPEWCADARLLLASGQIRRDGLVLVPIPRQGVPVGLRFLAAINELESSGWRVFPSDFDEEIPSFVQYLKELVRGAA